MRKKNIIFGVICFALVSGAVGNAFARDGDISMGTFSIPLPADGKDGCAPLIRSIDSSLDSSIADGCYTFQQRQQTRDGSGDCVDTPSCCRKHILAIA